MAPGLTVRRWLPNPTWILQLVLSLSFCFCATRFSIDGLGGPSSSHCFVLFLQFLTSLPLGAQVGRSLALGTDGPWADFNSFSQSSQWLSQAHLPIHLSDTWVKAFQSVRCLMNLPLQSFPAPKWQWLKLQIALILSHQMVTIHRLLVFEFVAL